MNTTLLFAELLIIGIQASVWFFLLALVIFGTAWLKAFTTFGLADWQTIIVIAGLSIVYVLGIIVDRLADWVFTSWDIKIRKRIFPNAPLTVGVMRFQLGKDNEYLNRQFEYIRSRMRIARASVLNFLLITGFGVILIFQQQFPTETEKMKFIVTALCVGVFLSASATYAWNQLTHTFLGQVKGNWDLLLSQKEAENKKKSAAKSKAG